MAASVPELLQHGGQPLDDLDRQLLLPRGLLKDQQGGQRFPVDLLDGKEGVHLLRDPHELARPVLSQVEEGEIHGDHGGVIALVPEDEILAHGKEDSLGFCQFTGCRGRPAFQPIDPDLGIGIRRGPVLFRGPSTSPRSCSAGSAVSGKLSRFQAAEEPL